MSIIKETASGYEVLKEEDILLTGRKIFLTSDVTSESQSGS